jgi:hypothetical protein
MKKTLCLMILAGAIVALYCANPFAPPKAGPGSRIPIASQNCVECPDSVNADSVLFNFKYAYENRDIDVYENCLDRDFIFRYIDQDRQGEIETVEIPRDGVSGDIHRTRGLFEAFNEIKLDTWIVSAWVPDTIIYHGEQEIWQESRVTFFLSLRDLTGSYNYQQFEANGLAVFKVRKSNDNYWRIVVWEDNSFTE